MDILPKISVVTPTLNSEKNIEACILSVANQSYENIEHLIIDGLSTDKTLEIVNGYVKKYPHIKLISEKDNGIYDAMNKGMRKANGKYTVFLNSDDFFCENDAVGLSVKALEKNNADFSYATMVTIEEGQKQKPLIDFFLFQIPFNHQTMFSKTALLKSLGGFNTQYSFAADFDLIIKMILCDFIGVEVPKIIVKYSINGVSNSLKYQNETIKITRENCKPFFCFENLFEVAEMRDGKISPLIFLKRFEEYVKTKNLKNINLQAISFFMEKKYLQQQIDKIQQKISNPNSLVSQKNNEIEFMKSSKFWKLRAAYIYLRRGLRFMIFSPKKFIKKYFRRLGVLKSFTKNNPPRVLAIVNHYYGKSRGFVGKSSFQDENIRKRIVKKTIDELKTIPNIDVKVCGIKNFSLVDIDVDFSYIKDPSFLIYETIEWMYSQIDYYDYFINIEDDILIKKETFERILDFDKKNPINECFYPNRMEEKDGKKYCVDLLAWPGWKEKSKNYSGVELKIALNPHSGISILSKEKLLYAKKKINLKKRKITIGHHMESAFANLHSPFFLFRAFSNIFFHEVFHLDNWDPCANLNKLKNSTKTEKA